jgi:integrase
MGLRQIFKVDAWWSLVGNHPSLGRCKKLVLCFNCNAQFWKGLFCVPKNRSLVRQAQDVLRGKLRIGEPRHLAKQQGLASDGIYSWSTYQNYLAKSCAFVKWAREEYGCRTLADARGYINDYLKHHINNGYSPYTQKLIACALAKLYGCSTKDFIPTQVRHRGNITRSRGSKAKFSESRNQEFVDFCKATGLRRHELKNLKPENLGFDESTGPYKLVNIKGKGGRLRDCPILDERAVVERMKKAPTGQNVWPKIPSRADIHSYRAEYCKAVYRLHARPIDEIPKNERYHCRGDLKGVIYDKRAMAIASSALGHNRISVIAGHYLYSNV